MDIAATLPKSGSTTWADEVEAEEAEFGQGMDFYSSLTWLYAFDESLVGIRLRRQTLQRSAMLTACSNRISRHSLYSLKIDMAIAHDNRAMSAPSGSND